MDADGRYSWDQLNADLNSLCDTIKNNSVVLIDWANADAEELKSFFDFYGFDNIISDKSVVEFKKQDMLLLLLL